MNKINFYFRNVFESNQILKTNFSKIPRQKLKVNIYSYRAMLTLQDYNSLLISIEEFLRNRPSNFD